MLYFPGDGPKWEQPFIKEVGREEEGKEGMEGGREGNKLHMTL